MSGRSRREAERLVVAGCHKTESERLVARVREAVDRQRAGARSAAGAVDS